MDGKAFEPAAKGRSRSVQMKVWLTPEEREEIASKAREAGMTQADFVLESARGTRVFVQRDEEKIELLLRVRYHLSRAGNNLNQIARTLHSATKSNRSAAAEAELDRIDDAVGEILLTLPKLHDAIESENEA